MKSHMLRYRTLLAYELGETTELMLESVRALPSRIQAPVKALITGGGKRLRPALVLLTSAICDAEIGAAQYVAAAVEMLHTATLIHDDLIDGAETRRGQTTLNRRLPAAATVLTGDAVFAVAARLAASTENPRLVHRFAETLEAICVGEIGQMFRDTAQPPSIETYYDRIFAKTASLFALCTESGAILAHCDPEQVRRSRDLGRLIGEAFQIADDVLDILGDEATLGKPIANDLRQGLITLPVIYYLESHPDDPRIDDALARRLDENAVSSLVADIKDSDAPERAMHQAESHIAEAHAILQTQPDSIHRRALEEIASFAVHRRY